MIYIENNEAEILLTNYFGTEAARAGYALVSTNAGCFRILLPEAMAAALDEMRTANSAEVERTRTNCLRIWFIDGTPSPFRLEVNHVDRMPLDSDAGRDDLVVSVWIEGPRKVLELPAKYLGRVR